MCVTCCLKSGRTQVCCYLDADPEAVRRLNFLKAPAESQVEVKESLPIEPALHEETLEETATTGPPLGAPPLTEPRKERCTQI